MDEEVDRTEPLVLLTGHTSPETAYLVEDYPYGYRLRCQIRYWVETAVKGAKKGQMRFMSQTTNPKRAELVWNAPKGSTYSAMVWMVQRPNGHIGWEGISEYGLNPEHDAQLHITGLYDQLTPGDRVIYDAAVRLAKRWPDSWERWEAAVSLLARLLATDPTVPELHNGSLRHEGQSVYIGDSAYPIAVAVARQRNTSTEDGAR